MASLSENPDELELEDFVAAHLQSRGVYVETGVTSREPQDILELDIVWTDYIENALRQNAVEVKSGKWQLGDLFKFYGWTQYLHLPPGQFVCKRLPERLPPEVVVNLCKRMNLQFIHIENFVSVDCHFTPLGLRQPVAPWIPSLWRFSYWAQRRLLDILSKAIGRGTCPESAKAAKNYAKLINDAIFFEPDVRSRVKLLFLAHQKHPRLALTSANELDGRGASFDNPNENCQVFREALYEGNHYPVQTCLYLGHRARLAILKAAVDYTIAKEHGLLREEIVKIFDVEIDVGELDLYHGFVDAAERLAQARSFKLFPTFWQVFLWGWGGFILTDRKDAEYAALSLETGVPVEEIDIALSAFDLLFSNASPWFKSPARDTRKFLKLMPTPMLGIGSFARLQRYGKSEYRDLGFTDDTARRMAVNHMSTKNLLDLPDGELVT